MRRTSFFPYFLSCFTFLGIVGLASPVQGQWGYSQGSNPGLNRAIYPPSQGFPRDNPVPYTTHRHNTHYPYRSNYRNGYSIPQRDVRINNVEIRCQQCQIDYRRDRPAYPDRSIHYPYRSYPYRSYPYQRW